MINQWNRRVIKMNGKTTNRRNFLKGIGIAGATLGSSMAIPKIIAKTSNGEVVESESEYGGFQVEKLSNHQFPYKIKPDVLQPMKYWTF